jgi:hypothetical protein
MCGQLPNGNKRKAINHWAGINNDSSATISRCTSADSIPGLVSFAKSVTAKLKADRRQKILEKQMEVEVEKETRRAALEVAAASLAAESAGSTSGSGQPVQGRLTFHASSRENLDKAIMLHIVEDGQILGLPQKPAFREMLDAAIAYGAETKGKVAYPPPGKKRIREDLLDNTVDRLKSELSSFDDYMHEFGATLVADGKDDVCKNHLTDYVTVTPNGYKFEGTQDVSGVERNAEWVATDLMKKLAGLETELRESLELGIKEMEADEDAALEAQQDQRARNAYDMLHAMSVGEGGALNQYVQIVTDTPSVNAKAWVLIENDIPHMHANPCSFHCVNLFFKHLLNGDKSNRAHPMDPIKECEDLVAWTKDVEQWFTNKDVPRALLLAECTSRWPSHGPRRMRKYSETRAANAFRVWHRAV